MIHFNGAHEIRSVATRASLIKRLALLLVFSMCLCATGCLNVEKECEECEEIGTEFITSFFDLDFDDMEDYCEDSDYLEAMEDAYTDQPGVTQETVEALLNRATVEVDSSEMEDGEITVTYIITFPDFDELATFVDSNTPIDEILDEVSGTSDYEVELVFVNDDGEWLIDDYEDLGDEIYGPLMSACVMVHNMRIQAVTEEIAQSMGG